MNGRAADPVRLWPWMLAVFGGVLIAQLGFVRLLGTDVPFYDQWDVEGRWLYPAWRDGMWHAIDFLRPLNEHRIAWTYALDLALFAWNGQWDPLVQLVAIALLRAACAAALVGMFVRELTFRQRVVVALVGFIAFLPHLPWHSVLWGIESQVYFALGFSLLALSWLGAETPSLGRQVAGVAFGVAALLAMGAANLVPVAVLALAGLRAAERRTLGAAFWREAWPALGLLGVAWLLRPALDEEPALRAGSIAEFVRAAGRALAWPHTAMPLAAIPMNVPLVILIVRRMRRRRGAAAGEDRVLLLAGWSAAIALATAWARGGSAELRAGVPSRYVDFLILLPLANAWCAWRLARESIAWRFHGVMIAWAAFVVIGWAGLSAEVMRGIVVPRARDREAPVRLMRAYQASGDAGVFAHQPRLLWPHPTPDTSVRPVLHDPRLRGALPPSLQPEQPMGPLSRAVRAVAGQ